MHAKHEGMLLKISHGEVGSGCSVLQHSMDFVAKGKKGAQSVHRCILWLSSTLVKLLVGRESVFWCLALAPARGGPWGSGEQHSLSTELSRALEPSQESSDGENTNHKAELLGEQLAPHWESK